MNFLYYFFPHKHPQAFFLPTRSEGRAGDGNRAAASWAAKDALAVGELGGQERPGLLLGLGRGIPALGTPCKGQQAFGDWDHLPSPRQLCHPSREVRALPAALAVLAVWPAQRMAEGRLTPKTGCVSVVQAARDPASGEAGAGAGAIPPGFAAGPSPRPGAG